MIDAANIDVGGNINLAGTDSAYAHNADRPALWIKVGA